MGELVPRAEREEETLLDCVNSDEPVSGDENDATPLLVDVWLTSDDRDDVPVTTPLADAVGLAATDPVAEFEGDSEPVAAEVTDVVAELVTAALLVSSAVAVTVRVKLAEELRDDDGAAVREAVPLEVDDGLGVNDAAEE